MIEHRLSRLLFALVADKLDLFSAERRLEKEKCSFYCVVYNKSMYVMGLKDFDASRQLSPTVHLPFYFNFRSLDLSLLHACFRGVLNYAMLLGIKVLCEQTREANKRIKMFFGLCLILFGFGNIVADFKFN